MSAEDDYRDGSALRQLREKVDEKSPSYPDDWWIEMTDSHESESMRLVTISVKDGEDENVADAMGTDIASVAHEVIELLG